jgi:glycine/sarcosine N-methyltransferase
MDFYDGFSRRFDRLMEWKRRRRKEEPFFRSILPADVCSILDCHCGTGFHCAMLASMGYEVEGLDISPQMLEVARQNLAARGLDVPLSLGDLKEFQPWRPFDCVLSMGNSLPHEFGDDNLLRSLQRMRAALRPGGLCILHIENFDRLYRDGDRFIPSSFSHTKRGAETFIFAIDYFKDRVVFNILSLIEEDGLRQFNVDVVEYNPVSIAKMKVLMTQAGFRAIEIYGDFNLTPIEKSESYDAIFVAHKGHNEVVL